MASPIQPEHEMEIHPMPSKPRQSSCHPNRRRTIDSLHLRVAGRRPRFPLMNQLSPGQVRQFQSLAAVYRADLLDPAAWEALLLLLEICNILDLLPGVVTRIFGPGMRERLETWSGEIPSRRRPSEVRRAWVWLSN